MRKQIFLLSFLMLIYCVTLAQVKATKHNEFYQTIDINAPSFRPNAALSQSIELAIPITSIAVEIPQNQSFEQITITTEGQELKLSKDLHSDLNTSNLIVFDKPIRQFEISNQGQENLKLHLFYAPPLPTPSNINKAYRVEDLCEKSPTVSGAQWRVGLPAPKELPTGTQVRHVIIHHAAGSNTATNYTEVVRNIFLLHTQTNGWNDIGYNFLVAQDGTVFEGRLGQGRLETDNVLGAHFCSKNANTMGICLLGNYQTTEPPQPMLNSLYKMIAWKLSKEKLTNVFASFMHPQGASSASMLGVISGHRDGCATDCPGDNVYKQLAQIRSQVSVACSSVLANEESFFEEIVKIYPQPATEEVFISSDRSIEAVAAHDITGKEIIYIAPFVAQNYFKINLKDFKSGVYILKIIQKGKIITKKLVLER